MPIFLVCPRYQNLAPKGRFFFGKDTLWGMFGALIPFLTSPRGEKPSSDAMGYCGRGAHSRSLRTTEDWGLQPALLPREARASGLSIPVRTRQGPQSTCPHVAWLSLSQRGA